MKKYTTEVYYLTIHYINGLLNLIWDHFFRQVDAEA